MTLTCPLVTMTRSVPIAWIFESTSRWAPSPIATITITEQTPITIPRVASAVRSLWPKSVAQRDPGAPDQLHRGLPHVPAP